MAGSQNTCKGSLAYTDSELLAFRRELSALAQTDCDYPLEYSLGSYELLFESRDDIQVIVENLSESIAELQPAA